MSGKKNGTRALEIILHPQAPDGPGEELIEAMNKAVESGEPVRAGGFDISRWQPEEAVMLKAKGAINRQTLCVNASQRIPQRVDWKPAGIGEEQTLGSLKQLWVRSAPLPLDGGRLNLLENTMGRDTRFGGKQAEHVKFTAEQVPVVGVTMKKIDTGLVLGHVRWPGSAGAWLNVARWYRNAPPAWWLLPQEERNELERKARLDGPLSPEISIV